MMRLSLIGFFTDGSNVDHPVVFDYVESNNIDDDAPGMLRGLEMCKSVVAETSAGVKLYIVLSESKDDD